jgi:hypothetical protein
MMHLMLTPEESRLLIRNLTHRIEHLDSELVHTDKRELQRALAQELQALSALTDRIRSSARTGIDAVVQTSPAPATATDRAPKPPN